MDGDLNIKWEIYAYLTIFAEKFKRIELNYVFYKPEEICIDVLEHRYKIKLNDSQYSNLKKYYSGEIKIDSLMSNFASSEEDIKKTLEFFNKINTGFNFIDCYVIQDKVCKNSKEIEFIENNSELLLIFDKHLIDERKIPCPVCGSLKISGNSYPEIGVKSWECKNPLCSERSKTNRGKRYSERTILMQNSAFDFSEQNQIPKSLVKKWRKDVIETIEESDFYRMLVKYYSYPGDKITVVNEKNTIIRDITQREKRELLVVPAAEFLPLEKVDESLYYNFMDNNEFFDNFLYIKNSNEHSNINFEDISRKNRKVKFIHGDSFEVLEAIGENVIHNMVTSPPYYNAREYSQWQNLYNYLNDMFGIICKSFKSLVPGGVFFYNIGDTFDNENIVVKSKMGEKRIPLGAYTILLFQKAGFELLDNVIWYKGEPQTNRHKNDGNYTPYYQRPANCYEHMFIFKKPGKLKLNEVINENSITSNIIKFTPVFKIFKGENKYGHTAPFPKKIPELSVNTFTNEEEIVLDPFSGSGTSAIVATLLNRVGVGIEINKEYVELSSSKAKEEGLSSEIIKE